MYMYISLTMLMTRCSSVRSVYFSWMMYDLEYQTVSGPSCTAPGYQFNFCAKLDRDAHVFSDLLHTSHLTYIYTYMGHL